ncbi:ATP-binding protein [Streptomyces sp. 184]|uniref:ATP-binding protein n=1 Tax=Streptomyces sp. 184 TaxID=1827526 RepID=UPI0038929A79
MRRPDVTQTMDRRPVLVQHFDGEYDCVSRARDTAAVFLEDLEGIRPPSAPERPYDVLLVVSELAANTFCYAPGPFTLTMRDTGEEIHVALRDSSIDLPRPRRVNLSAGSGIGWYLINTLALEAFSVREPDGKSVHVFLPW